MIKNANFHITAIIRLAATYEQGLHEYFGILVPFLNISSMTMNLEKPVKIKCAILTSSECFRPRLNILL